MKKKGAITMKYLLTLILGAVLLVLIIYGVQTKGFGPLFENIEGRYNEVLIILGVRDDGTPACEGAFPETIDSMSGKFYPCEEYCTFELTSPEDLLGFGNFSIDKGGFAAVFDNGVKSYNDAYSFDIVEAQRHKDAYDVLVGSIDEFLTESGMGEVEFVRDMSFDKSMTLFFRVDKFGDDTYEYNGEGWLKDGDKDISEAEVVSEIWSNYPRNPINWNYKGDGNSNLIVTGYNENYENVEYSREDIVTWLDELIGEEERQDKLIVISIGKGEIYLREGAFKEEGDVVEKGYVANKIRDANLKGLELYWNLFVTKEYTYAVVSDDPIKDLKNPLNLDKKRFQEWLGWTRNDFDNSIHNQETLMNNFKDFLRGSERVDFEGKPVKVSLDFLLPPSRAPVVYFMTSGSGGFGVYYKNGKAVLTHDNVDSPVSDFVGLPDDEWPEFVKINKIYEYFKLRRCRAE